MTPKIVTDLCNRVLKLETKMDSLMTIQKWQLGMLSTIVAGVLVSILHK